MTVVQCADGGLRTSRGQSAGYPGLDTERAQHVRRREIGVDSARSYAGSYDSGGAAGSPSYRSTARGDLSAASTARRARGDAAPTLETARGPAPLVSSRGARGSPLADRGCPYSTEGGGALGVTSELSAARQSAAARDASIAAARSAARAAATEARDMRDARAKEADARKWVAVRADVHNSKARVNRESRPGVDMVTLAYNNNDDGRRLAAADAAVHARAEMRSAVLRQHGHNQSLSGYNVVTGL